jgi:4-diphosphocytidyl-2-C-methyl-D-erythritol kinase
MNKELPDHIPPEKNLVWKGASLLQEHCHIPHGFSITLKKNIPAAAGLAGGSSDCAATLLGINELCGLNLSIGELCEIGVSLGADIPFCIQKGTMLAEGFDKAPGLDAFLGAARQTEY